MKTTATVDAWSSALDLSKALEHRQISATELLQMYRDRIEHFNPVLNAIVVECFDRAEARAREIDSVAPDKRPAPLYGLPMTVKESLEVTGLQTTGGVVSARGRISEFDSPHVQALTSAGMSLMGKTNIPSECADWQSNSPVYGRTNNPWNLDRSPGGSSGGSAAALAAGLTPLEIGTDIGGSVRVPANYCGLYGLRPSETAVPRWGDSPGSSLPNPSVAMSVCGPLARHAEDLELALDIIGMPDPGEDAGWHLNIRPARRETLRDFRVGFLGELDWVPLSNDVQRAIEHVRFTLERAGATIVEVDPEALFAGSWRHHLDYTTMLMAIMGPDLSADDREFINERLTDRPELWSAVNEAFESPPYAVFGWFARREQQRERYRSLFQDIDLLVAPISLRTAFPHKPEQRVLVDLYDRTIEIDGVEHPYDLNVVYPGTATFAGQPAVAFPTGLGEDGMPVGLQAIGPYLEDRTPIRFAELMAQEIGGFTPPPGY